MTNVDVEKVIAEAFPGVLELSSEYLVVMTCQHVRSWEYSENILENVDRQGRLFVVLRTTR